MNDLPRIAPPDALHELALQSRPQREDVSDLSALMATLWRGRGLIVILTVLAVIA